MAARTRSAWKRLPGYLYPPALEPRRRRQIGAWAVAVLFLGAARTGYAQSAPSAADPPATVPPASIPPAAAHPSVHLSGFVQVDWVVRRQSSLDEVDPATLEPLNQDRFLLRRARLRATAQRGLLAAVLELDANTLSSAEVRPFEATVSARWPERVDDSDFGATARDSDAPVPFAVQASAGLMRIPFGFDAVEVATQRPLLEHSLGTRAFFGAARDLGADIEVLYRFIRVSAALMNGEPLGESGAYAGRDLTRAKDLIFRAGVTQAVGPVRLDAGVSWLSGTGLHPGSPATKNQLAWVDGNENGLVEVSELTSIPGTPATASQAFSREALGADARLAWEIPQLGRLSLRGEIVRAQNLDRSLVPADPVATGRPLRELAAHLALSQELTRHLEIAGRYDLYNPDSDAQRSKAGVVVPADPTYRSYSIALAAKASKARLMAQFDHHTDARGRTLSGMPTSLRDDTFTLRAEVGF